MSKPAAVFEKRLISTETETSNTDALMQEFIDVFKQ